MIPVQTPPAAPPRAETQRSATRVIVRTEDGASVRIVGRASAPVIARMRRSGANARAVFEVPSGTYRIRCDIPGELDPVEVQVVVGAEDAHVSCFAN